MRSPFPCESGLVVRELLLPPSAHEHFQNAGRRGRPRSAKLKRLKRSLIRISAEKEEKNLFCNADLHFVFDSHHGKVVLA